MTIKNRCRRRTRNTRMDNFQEVFAMICISLLDCVKVLFDTIRNNRVIENQMFKNFIVNNCSILSNKCGLKVYTVTHMNLHSDMYV